MIIHQNLFINWKSGGGTMLTAFIMAGGKGERFWPLSTKERPKQLLKLISDKSMIRHTVDRILPMISADKIFIGTNIVQVAGIKEELPFIPEENIIIEPVFKDTAAAIGYGVTVIESRYPNSSTIVLASDHYIKNEENFRKMMITAVESAEKDHSIVTLGVKPTKPETGYGYIEVAENCYVGNAVEAKRFWEKPNLHRAKKYVEAGNYLWNSGMFIFENSTIFSAMQQHMPHHHEILQNIREKLCMGRTGIELSMVVMEDFEKFEKISIDFGIMEKAKNLMVIPVDFGWSDIGSFSAMEEVFEKNKNGTVEKVKNLIEVNSKNNIVFGTGKKIIAIVGVQDTIVVETEHATLICKKDDVQNIREILKKIDNS